MNEILKNSTLLFLIIAIVYLGGIGFAKLDYEKTKQQEAIVDTIFVEKKQIVKTKQDIDYTNTTQDDSLLLYEMDSIEMDSIDEYHRYWYEVLDTNSNGDIDDTENEQ